VISEPVPLPIMPLAPTVEEDFAELRKPCHLFDGFFIAAVMQ